MTGKEIHSMLAEKHRNYVLSKEDNLPRPAVLLSVHQIHKLLDHASIYDSIYNQLIAAAYGDLTRFNFLSLIIEVRQ